MESLIIVGIAFWAVFMAFGARGRVDTLTKRVKALEDAQNTRPQSAPTPVGAAPAPLAESGVVSAVTVPSMSAMPPLPTEPGFDLVDWVKKDWLLKLGALCVLVACGWFVSYAFMNGWIGPMGRITLGLTVGALMLALGSWRIRTEPGQGAIFTVIGATTILMTTFAARSIYDFFTPFSALALIFITAAFVAALSAVHRHKSLAVCGTVLAGMAPLFVDSPTVNYLGLNAYLMAVTLGALILVYRTGFREVTFLCLVIYSVYSVQHLLNPADDRLFVYACAFAAIFFLANIVGMVRRGSVNLAFDATLAFVNTLVLLAHIYTYVPEVWQSLTTAAWAVVFVAGSFIALRLTKDRRPFLIYAAVSAVCIAAATAFELDGPALTIALTIESALATFVIFTLTNNRSIAERTSFVMLGSALLAVESMASDAWRTSAIHGDALVVMLAAVAFLSVGSVLQARGGEEVRADGSHMVYHPWQHVVGGLFVVALIWLTTHAIMPDGVATMASLVIYVVSGLSLYFTGSTSGDSRVKAVGVVLLLGSIARLLLVDVWQLELPVRIMTFFAIGALLLGTAFIRKASKHN